MRKLLAQLESKPLEPVILRLLSAWCVSSMGFYIAAGGEVTELTAFSRFPLWLVLLSVSAGYTLIWGAGRLTRTRVEIWALPLCFLAFSLLTAATLCDWYVAFLLTALWAALVFYYQKQGLIRLRPKITRRSALLAVGATAAVFALLVGGVGVLRYLSYRAPNYDFGIFSQMFYSMKTRFTPVTTCERDGALSHFAIHASPILYLLLPVYAVFSSPATLQICQALILASAAVPLWLLGRRRGLSPAVAAGATVLLLLHPAVAGGTNYDFHENCFLLPLLLWTFYFFEREKYLPMAVFALLTLCVKEDAAVYLIFFALFIAADRRNYRVSAALALGAAVWFAAALFLLSHYGNGVMVNRYRNFIVGDGGLPEAVRNLLADPGYAFTQLLTDSKGGTEEKLLFLFQMFAPLALLPFCVKKISRLTLLFPLILINLLTTYVYQFNIGYQYSFGSAAFVFYLCVLNLEVMDRALARRFLAIGLFACALCLLIGPMDRAVTYADAYFGEREAVSAVNEALAEVPDDASVICSTYLLPRLSQRDTLYEVSYHKPAEGERVDYVILDARYNYLSYVERYEALGYRYEKTVSAGGRPLLYILRGGDSP